MASRLGAGRRRNGGAVFPDRSFRLWLASADCCGLAPPKNLEWPSRAVLSVLAAELRPSHSTHSDAARLVRVAPLEIRTLFARKSRAGGGFSLSRHHHFRSYVLHQDGAVGLGQSQGHGVGLVYRSAVFVDAPHR